MAIAALVAAAGAAATGGARAGAYRFDAEREDVIAADVEIAGLAVGGLTPAEARAALERTLVQPLERPLTLVAGERSWTFLPSVFGVQVDVESALERAHAASRKGDFLRRTHRDVTRKPLELRVRLVVERSDAGVSSVVERIANAIDRPTRDATLTWTSTSLRTTPGPRGGPGPARCPGAADRCRRRPSGRTASDRRPDRAGGTREDAGDAGPGPSDVHHREQGAEGAAPLRAARARARVSNRKARWLGIHDGAGIHGTSELSSLGREASRGCIRMSVPDVIELYDRVSIGTPIYIG